MYVWAHLYMSSTHHINPSATGHFLALGGVLEEEKEEGEGSGGEGRAPSILSASLCALPNPPTSLKMGELWESAQ